MLTYSALQRCIPHSHEWALSQWVGSMHNGFTETKKRIDKTWERVTEALIHGGKAIKRVYIKHDKHTGGIHTKLELESTDVPISMSEFSGHTNPLTQKLVIPIYHWQSHDHAMKLLAQFYAGENLGIIVLCIEMILQAGDENNHHLFSDFRKTLPEEAPQNIRTLLTESLSLPDGDGYHNNKLAKRPASTWQSGKPSHARMAAIDTQLRLSNTFWAQ